MLEKLVRRTAGSDGLLYISEQPQSVGALFVARKAARLKQAERDAKQKKKELEAARRRKLGSRVPGHDEDGLDDGDEEEVEDDDFDNGMEVEAGYSEEDYGEEDEDEDEGG